MSKKKLSFGDLDDKLSKISPLGSIVTKNEFSKIDHWIPTGNYMLNAQVSGSLFGGIPNCRSVCLAGDSGTGKSFLTMNICREAQLIGYDVIYCDSEAAVDQETFEKFGLDPNRVRYQPVNTVQEFSVFVNNLTKLVNDAIASGAEPPKIFLVLDSLGNLASSKEKEDSISGKGVRDMTKQQIIRSLFRTATVDLAAAKIPLVLTNHVYQGMGMFASKEISGGGGIIYNTSIILMLTKAKLKEGTKQDKAEADKLGLSQTGIIVSSWPKKNRFARPIPIRFHISFFKGMNKFTGLEKYITWDLVGIGRGELHDEKMHSKWKDAQKESFDYERYSWKQTVDVEEVDKETGEITVTGTKEVTWYFVEKQTARSYVVKHLSEKVPIRDLFTDRVLPEDLLRELDENEIKPTFMLPDIHSLEDLAFMEENLDELDED